MTTTARIAVTTSADTYEASIASGAVGNFKAFGLTINETIKIEGKNAAGGFGDITYIDPGGNRRHATLGYLDNTLQLSGPLDFKITKPVTAGAAGVDEYS